MSSLKDQLLKAGFKEPPKKKSAPTRKNKSTQQHSKQAAEAQARAAIAKRKELKEKIVAIINEHQLKDYAGESVCHYTVGNRIRQIYLKEDIHKKFSDGDLVITRLNGATYLIDSDIATQILAINPEWAVFRANDKNATEETDGYEDFPVPDDLQW